MRIVVGVDGSEGSRAALRHALFEARVHHAEVVVMHAWAAAFESVYPNEALETTRTAAEREAAELVERMVAQAQAEFPRPLERVTARPVEGDPAQVLLAEALEDDVIVVGLNDALLVRRLVMGSVCARVVRSARCPVTVVPARAP